MYATVEDGASGAVLVVTGPPGAGKSTVARELIRRFDRAVLLDGDAFFQSIRRGFILPWEPAAQQQNEVVTRALGSAANEYAAGGYPVVVDGIVGPWMLPAFTGVVTCPLNYAVIRPSREAAMQRATARGAPHLVDPAPIAKMYDAFADVGPFERCVIDSSDLDAVQTAQVIEARAAAGELGVTELA
jgi:AAA domain-containing protein